MDKENPKSEFPEKIRMRGFPFLSQGWNSIYKKTDQVSDGCPVYRLEPYNLYHMIAIIGVTIFRKDGIWVLQVDGDSAPLYKRISASTQNGPEGYWPCGGYTTAVTVVK